jgi:hypothetical protein
MVGTSAGVPARRGVHVLGSMRAAWHLPEWHLSPRLDSPDLHEAENSWQLIAFTKLTNLVN